MSDTPIEPVGEGIWTRLRRRKVVQWGIAYAAGAWGLLQGLAYVTDIFHWPEYISQSATLALLIGLPIMLVLAWYHGDRGERRVRRTELAIITLLFLAGGGIFWLYNHRTADTTASAQPPPTAVATATDRSIAVLPFVNMSADKEQEYFADGISEELLNLLAQVPELRVIARTSSFSFKGKEVDIAEVARTLNVANVLEGSVRRSGDTLRITAQLIRASDSSHLWSQTYDRQMTDVFKMQDEIAGAVVTQLKIKLLDAAPKARATDSQAYTLFLQARDLSRQYTQADFEQSNKLYQQALAIDPAYAPAWIGLADNYSEQVFNTWLPPESGLRLAHEATQKALAIDADSADAHASRARISMYRLDLAVAARQVEHTFLQDRANPDLIGVAAALARRLGRFDQAITLAQYRIRLDPVDAIAYEDLAYAYRYAGRLDDALDALRTVLRLSPRYVMAHEGIGELLLQKGDADAALAEMHLEESEPGRLLGSSMALHALGRQSDSEAILAELIEKYEKPWSFNIAYAQAFRGDSDRAFQQLWKAKEYGDPYLGAAAFFPMFDKIHADPRWLPFLKGLGLAPEQLAAIKFDVKVPQ